MFVVVATRRTGKETDRSSSRVKQFGRQSRFETRFVLGQAAFIDSVDRYFDIGIFHIAGKVQ